MQTSSRLFYHPIQYEATYTPDTFIDAVDNSYVPGQEPPFQKTEYALMLSVIFRYWKQVNEYYKLSPAESVTPISTM